jgi:hypothetical protein
MPSSPRRPSQALGDVTRTGSRISARCAPVLARARRTWTRCAETMLERSVAGPHAHRQGTRRGASRGSPDAEPVRRSCVGSDGPARRVTSPRKRVKVAMGTDCPVAPHGTNLRAGTDGRERVHAATGPRRGDLSAAGSWACRTNSGRRPGKRADVVVDGDALVFEKLPSGSEPFTRTAFASSADRKDGSSARSSTAPDPPSPTRPPRSGPTHESAWRRACVLTFWMTGVPFTRTCPTPVEYRRGAPGWRGPEPRRDTTTSAYAPSRSLPGESWSSRPAARHPPDRFLEGKIPSSRT